MQCSQHKIYVFAQMLP